jgi:hypothetical protein
MPDGSEAELRLEEDFAYVLRLLPEGWQKQAKALGALRRCRKVADAESLLRVLLIHLAEGCSLRETALRVQRAQIANLSDVAIMDRLRLAGEWFRWMNTQLIKSWALRQPKLLTHLKRPVRLVDATRVAEPGPTGSSWVVHYCIDLSSLSCQQIILTDYQGNGESFERFSPQPNELYIADRAYGARPGIFHCVQAQAEVLVRFSLHNLPLQNPAGQHLDLLRRLRKLKAAELGDWPVELQYEKQTLSGRVCAVRRSRQAALQAQQKALQESRQHARQIQPRTLESAAYVFVFTTLSAAELSAGQALELYRGRWQIELVFKRLKSIMALGHLRKIDPRSARSWLEGKLFVALLIESLLRHAESFFPWGFPLEPPPPLPLA